jgi:hypothetical protein
MLRERTMEFTDGRANDWEENVTNGWFEFAGAAAAVAAALNGEDSEERRAMGAVGTPRTKSSFGASIGARFDPVFIELARGDTYCKNSGVSTIYIYRAQSRLKVYKLRTNFGLVIMYR